jgi:micrococcal nuclease
MAGRIFRRRRPPPVWLLAIVILVIAARYFRSTPDSPSHMREGIYQIARVVDGDTLLLEDGTRVRLIGVDAPESVKPDHPVEPWGKEAFEFTSRFIASGETRLEFDRERVDDFGRTLAYVWVGRELLNEALIREGLARARLKFNYSPQKKRLFRQAQEEARKARRGIWSGKAHGKAGEPSP